MLLLFVIVFNICWFDLIDNVDLSLYTIMQANLKSFWFVYYYIKINVFYYILITQKVYLKYIYKQIYIYLKLVHSSKRIYYKYKQNILAISIQKQQQTLYMYIFPKHQ